MKKILVLFLSVFLFPIISFGETNQYIQQGFDIDTPILWHPKAVQLALENLNVPEDKFSFLVNIYAKYTNNNTTKISILDMSYLWLITFKDQCPIQNEECQAQAADFATNVITEHNKLVIESRNQIPGKTLTEEEANELFEYFFASFCKPSLMPIQDRDNVKITKIESDCNIISPDLKNTFQCELSAYYSNTNKCVLTCPEVVYEEESDNMKANSSGCSTKVVPAN